MRYLNTILALVTLKRKRLREHFAFSNRIKESIVVLCKRLCIVFRSFYKFNSVCMFGYWLSASVYLIDREKVQRKRDLKTSLCLFWVSWLWLFTQPLLLACVRWCHHGARRDAAQQWLFTHTLFCYTVSILMLYIWLFHLYIIEKLKDYSNLILFMLCDQKCW